MTRSEDEIEVNDAKFVAAISAEAVPLGKGVVCQLEGCSILICNADGQFFAVENQCSHAQERLECGAIRNGWISCPAHGARFDLETGEALRLPATEPIRTFPIRVVDGTIEVKIR